MITTKIEISTFDTEGLPEILKDVSTMAIALAKAQKTLHEKTATATAETKHGKFSITINQGV